MAHKNRLLWPMAINQPAIPRTQPEHILEGANSARLYSHVDQRAIHMPE